MGRGSVGQRKRLTGLAANLARKHHGKQRVDHLRVDALLIAQLGAD